MAGIPYNQIFSILCIIDLRVVFLFLGHTKCKDDQCASWSLIREKPRTFASYLIVLEHFQSVQNHNDSHAAPLNFFSTSTLSFSPWLLYVHWYSSQISALISLAMLVQRKISSCAHFLSFIAVQSRRKIITVYVFWKTRSILWLMWCQQIVSGQRFFLLGVLYSVIDNAGYQSHFSFFWDVSNKRSVSK